MVAAAGPQPVIVSWGNQPIAGVLRLELAGPVRWHDDGRVRELPLIAAGGSHNDTIVAADTPAPAGEPFSLTVSTQGASQIWSGRMGNGLYLPLLLSQ